MFISTIVLSEPDDATLCEGTLSTEFNCELNGSMASEDVQWHRILKDASNTERVSRQEGFTVVPIPGVGSFTTKLFIMDVKRSYTGYYWVSSPVGDVCNTSFIVSTGIYTVCCI